MAERRGDFGWSRSEPDFCPGISAVDCFPISTTTSHNDGWTFWSLNNGLKGGESCYVRLCGARYGRVWRLSCGPRGLLYMRRSLVKKQGKPRNLQLSTAR